MVPKVSDSRSCETKPDCASRTLPPVPLRYPYSMRVIAPHGPHPEVCTKIISLVWAIDSPHRYSCSGPSRAVDRNKDIVVNAHHNDCPGRFFLSLVVKFERVLPDKALGRVCVSCKKKTNWLRDSEIGVERVIEINRLIARNRQQH